MLHRSRLSLAGVARPLYFDRDWYLSAYPDVAAAGMDPLRHYLRYGREEGRLPCFMTAAWRERDLRWGLLENAPDSLESLALTPRGQGQDANRVWAALACARACARQGDWAGADRWLRPLDPDRELLRGFCLPDPALLAIEAAIMARDLPRARALWRRARALFGPRPDLQLARANIAAAEAGPGTGWLRIMRRLYGRHLMGGLALGPPHQGQPDFDRLRAPRRAGRPHQGPLVSVVMPARNAEATIATALRSLCEQSWANLQILVVDNGSTDRTAEITRACARRDPRIQLIDGHDEPGTYAARNLGMSRATGDFLTILDADDWTHPARIARQVRTLQKNPASAASMTHWVRTTPDLRFTRWWREDGLTHPDISSLMIRRAVLDKLGFWDRARAAADTEYHQRLIAVLGADAVREVHPGLPLSFGRLRPQSLTQHSATGIETHLFGPRRDYMLAGRRWHRRLRPQDLPLPRHPERRPFAIPAALALSPPDPDPAPAGEHAVPDPYQDDWYMRTYPDLRTRDQDGWDHYQDRGEAEGRNPGPGFASSAYRLAHGPFEGLALHHYQRQGRAAGLDPLPEFPGQRPSAAAEGRHILVFGHLAGQQIFGAERCLPDLLDRAYENGRTASVVLPQILNADYLAALQARCHRVHVVPYGWIFGGVAPHPDTVARLAGLIRSSGATEIHQNTAVLDAPLYAARAAGVASVVHVHELPAQDPRLCMDLGCGAEELRRHLLRHADRFVANSPAVQHWLDLPADRVQLLPNRVSPGLRALPFQPQQPLRVALIGSLTAKKGVADLVEVARICARRRLPLRFVMIGPHSPDLDPLRPWPDTLRHVGYAANPETAIAQADIVLSLSHFAESFGLTVLEAMSAGRPVICYDRGTPPQLLGQSGAGMVVPADDPAAVAAALADLARDPTLLQAASRAARARAAVLHSQAEQGALTVFKRAPHN